MCNILSSPLSLFHLPLCLILDGSLIDGSLIEDSSSPSFFFFYLVETSIRHCTILGQLLRNQLDPIHHDYIHAGIRLFLFTTVIIKIPKIWKRDREKLTRASIGSLFSSP